MKLEKINKYGLLYHLPGQDKHKKAILFMAHQDVVPAGHPETWTWPPFEAHFDGKFLLGRGSADCKSNLIGILSAMEALLKQDFKPKRSIIFSFGFDEETGGYRGAANLARHIEDKLGADSIAMIHDEGGMGVSALGDVAYALPAAAEKGFVDVILTIDMPGGHSSRPPKHTAIGIMSKLISALEDYPFEPSLADSNPVRGVLECEATYSEAHIEPWLKKALQSGDDIGPRIAEAREGTIRWQIQTSQAVDVIRGGEKDNQLPEEVAAVVNYRIAPPEDVDQFFKDLADLLAGVAHRYNLTLSGMGYEEYKPSNGILRLESKDLLLPSPVTSTSQESDVWTLFSSTLRQVFQSVHTLPDVKTVVPVGSIATGNSDTAHYWNLTKNIFRFTPTRVGSRMGVHTVNERMEMSAHLEAVRVYYELMRNFQGHEGDTCEGVCRTL
jgi:Gly-Xaa carboxypeptidase